MIWQAFTKNGPEHLVSFALLLALWGLTACSYSGGGKELEPNSMDNGVSSLSDVKLRSLGEAPELKNEIWLNTETSLRLADLRGRVVLLEMWTFG